MIKNYFKIAWRNLFKNKGYSAINIGGLAVGMAVVMLITLWIMSELNFNKYHKNYDRVAVVMQHQTFDGERKTQRSLPLPISDELLLKYGSNFKNVVKSWWTMNHTLTFNNVNYTQSGKFMENGAIELLSLKLLRGTQNALQEPNAIILSESVAKAMLGNTDPLNQIVTIDNKMPVKIAGIYEDFPNDSEFKDVKFIAPWRLFLANNEFVQKSVGNWGNNAFECFVEIADNTSFEQVSDKIKNVKLEKLQGNKEQLTYNPQLFLHPMSQWHLFEKFKDGKNIGGGIQTVRLFGLIGIFILLLACINFMNLSTARSEKRAKEVGVRKVLGSEKKQLILQYLTEPLLVSGFAFLLSILLMFFLLPIVKDIADKKTMTLPTSPLFWVSGILFTLFVSFLAGIYPAFYLSSFNPIKVLKGSFKVGQTAVKPRKALVVIQFSVSVVLIICTVFVYRQIQFAKNRPLGYEQNGLISVQLNSDDFNKNYNSLRQELLNSGAVLDVAVASCPPTEVQESQSGFDWHGKDPNAQGELSVIRASQTYGKTMAWKMAEGRDFEPSNMSDKQGVLLNESAVKAMNLTNPVGEIIKSDNKSYTVLGVVKDLIMGSPYEPVHKIVYLLSENEGNFAYFKLNPQQNTHESIAKIEAAFKKFVPSQSFDYDFADKDYAKRFGDEVRIGKLATFFAILAIFISCLGLFGLAAFSAEQRIKEIGIRKVLGASISNITALLSRDFLKLVLIGILIATPVAWSIMNSWLENYTYRTTLNWWVFALAGLSAVLIALLTVSFQAIRAAVANPVKSLRTE